MHLVKFEKSRREIIETSHASSTYIRAVAKARARARIHVAFGKRHFIKSRSIIYDSNLTRNRKGVHETRFSPLVLSAAIFL